MKCKGFWNPLGVYWHNGLISNCWNSWFRLAKGYYRLSRVEFRGKACKPYIHIHSDLKIEKKKFNEKYLCLVSRSLHELVKLGTGAHSNFCWCWKKNNFNFFFLILAHYGTLHPHPMLAVAEVAADFNLLWEKKSKGALTRFLGITCDSSLLMLGRHFTVLDKFKKCVV